MAVGVFRVAAVVFATKMGGFGTRAAARKSCAYISILGCKVSNALLLFGACAPFDEAFRVRVTACSGTHFGCALRKSIMRLCVRAVSVCENAYYMAAVYAIAVSAAASTAFGSFSCSSGCCCC